MRSKSAGGLMVKALGQNLRDLGLSPSQWLTFSCYKIALEKIIYLIQDELSFVWV